MSGTPERLGHYRILRKLGAGGMGVVYEARDEKLGRSVAIKMVADRGDEQLRKRFLREARAAARVSHPGVCQIHEIGEDAGAPFIAMELLAGEPLSARIDRGPLSVAETVRIGLEMLGALEALHGSGIVHRDLKPANVFLTPHGIKLLDFGLARELQPAGEQTASVVTQAGSVVGTPHYIAPEQLRGEAVDGRTDVFSLGAILFELLTGRRAFGGRTMMEVLHAALYEHPPALAGSSAVVAVDRVIRRALAKRPDDRYPTVAEMARELRACLLIEDTGEAARTHAITRLIVLPFRALRPDPDTDFLAFSLPDAITTSLSGLEALVVRSSLAAARFAGDAPDLKRIASEADVDVVLTGTLLRSGDQLRVSAQLVEAPGGALVWSQAAQTAVGDVFKLQDDLVQRLVESLSLPLTAREHKLLRRDVPASPRAYELYLRANRLALESETWEVARDLYVSCLEEDPRYAPAWARLGRVYRLLAKYQPQGSEQHIVKAEAAFRRALDLNPDLGLAHSLYAAFEVEAGRSTEAMRRLLQRTSATHGAEPEVFAGLVHVLRYCGLLEASIAAHAQAQRLDPGLRTSVAYTFFLLGEYEKAIASDNDDERYITRYVKVTMGRTEEAGLRELADVHGHGPRFHRLVAESQLAAVEGRPEVVVEVIDRLALHSGFRDPEGIYFIARTFTRVGKIERGLELLAKVVDAGFHPLTGFARDPWLDPARADPRFREMLKRAQARQKDAQAAFTAADGERLLGMP